MGFANHKNRGLLVAALVFGATVALVWFGNGLTPWWPLMWFAPLPVLWFSLRTSWWRAGLMTAAAWLVGSLNLLPYLRLLGSPFLAWLGIFGPMALMVAAGVLLFRALLLRGALWSAIVALPALWVTTDWVRNWASPHGTAADLAYTQLHFLPFLQLASLTGPWGMSFLLLLAPSAAVAFLYLRKRERRHANRVATAVGVLFLAVLAFGIVRLTVPAKHESVEVGLIASDAKENDGVVAPGADAERLLRDYEAQAKALAARGAQVIVMPEKIAVVRDLDERMDDAQFQALANADGLTIVLGELHVSPSSDGVVRYNRAEVYEPRASVATYDKEHMLPPFESNLKPGTAKLTMRRDGQTWGVAICKDMDFTSMGRAYGRLGTGLMLVPAWDFHMDRTWHGHMAVMRGVEGGFSIARASKDGYLTVSDNRGRILAEARTDSAPFVTLLADVPVGHTRTLFDAWGDWFAWVAVALLGWVLLKAMMLLAANRNRSRREVHVAS